MHLHHAYGNNAYPVIPAGQVLPADESARFDMPSWQPLQEPPHCGRPPLHPYLIVILKSLSTFTCSSMILLHFLIIDSFKFRSL